MEGKDRNSVITVRDQTCPMDINRDETDSQSQGEQGGHDQCGLRVDPEASEGCTQDCHSYRALERCFSQGFDGVRRQIEDLRDCPITKNDSAKQGHDILQGQEPAPPANSASGD